MSRSSSTQSGPDTARSHATRMPRDCGVNANRACRLFALLLIHQRSVATGRYTHARSLALRIIRVDKSAAVSKHRAVRTGNCLATLAAPTTRHAGDEIRLSVIPAFRLWSLPAASRQLPAARCFLFADPVLCQLPAASWATLVALSLLAARCLLPAASYSYLTTSPRAGCRRSGRWKDSGP
jgi:hypothetical protein